MVAAEDDMEHAPTDSEGAGRLLAGRRVLITGASSGIGAATARAVVAAGGSVALLARREPVLTTLANELRARTLAGRPTADVRVLSTPDGAAATDAPAGGAAAATDAPAGGAAAAMDAPAGAAATDASDGDSRPDEAPHGMIQRIVVAPADVADADACRAAVEQAAGALGGLDGLVNAAGVLRPGSTLDGDPADWQLMLDVNVRGVLHATAAAADHLRTAATDERPVDVVNVSSMSGRRLLTTEVAVYAASKAAVHMVSEGMRREFAADGIRLAVISPGVVATDLFAGDDDTTAALARKAAEAGLGADDVAAAILGLLAAPAHVVHAEIALRHIDQ